MAPFNPELVPPTYKKLAKQPQTLRPETRKARVSFFSARLFIPEKEWGTVTVWCDGRVKETTSELEVTQQFVEVYTRHIERKNT